MMRQKKILLTGCAGYVGGAFLLQAVERGYYVRCIDRLVYGGQHIAGLMYHPNIEFIHGDIRDQELIDRAMEGVDAVVHLAAIVGDLPCQVAPKSTLQINFNATRNLAIAAKSSGVERFVFASTCSNYGITDPSVPADENNNLNPVSLYAESKIDCERFLMELGDESFHTTALRFATAYGISFRTRFDLTVNSFAYEALRDNEIVVFAADLWRPYIHVYDMGKLMLTVLEAESGKISNEIFNAGCNQENYTKREVVMILKELLPDLKTKFITKEDDKRSYRVDFTKIEKTLGFKPLKTVRDGFVELIDSFRKGILTSEDYNGNKLDTLKKFYAEQESVLAD